MFAVETVGPPPTSSVADIRPKKVVAVGGSCVEKLGSTPASDVVALSPHAVVGPLPTSVVAALGDGPLLDADCVGSVLAMETEVALPPPFPSYPIAAKRSEDVPVAVAPISHADEVRPSDTVPPIPTPCSSYDSGIPSRSEPGHLITSNSGSSSEFVVTGFHEETSGVRTRAQNRAILDIPESNFDIEVMASIVFDEKNQSHHKNILETWISGGATEVPYPLIQLYPASTAESLTVGVPFSDVLRASIKRSTPFADGFIITTPSGVSGHLSAKEMAFCWSFSNAWGPLTELRIGSFRIPVESILTSCTWVESVGLEYLRRSGLIKDMLKSSDFESSFPWGMIRPWGISAPLGTVTHNVEAKISEWKKMLISGFGSAKQVRGDIWVYEVEPTLKGATRTMIIREDDLRWLKRWVSLPVRQLQP